MAELINEITKKRAYYLAFVNKNKEKINEAHVCDVCFGRYTYFNKSKHMKSKLHLRIIEHKNKNLIYP